MIIIKRFFILLITVSFLYAPLHAAGNDSNAPKKLKSYDSAKIKITKAKKLEKKGKIKKAKKLYKMSLKFLHRANRESPSEPDIFNYLGFVNRKLNNFEDAEVYYLIGLELDPNHPGINEYLGELYIKTNRVDKAKERLSVLKGCDCEEFDELNAAIKKNVSKY